MKYPIRTQLFFTVFLRVFHKSEAVRQLGPDASVLLLVVMTMEDEGNFANAVPIHDQVLSLHSGFRSLKNLHAARARAVEAGWLHYEPIEAHHAAGRYWVTIPDHLTAMEATVAAEALT